jgi:hypothetical protein
VEERAFIVSQRVIVISSHYLCRPRLQVLHFVPPFVARVNHIRLFPIHYYGRYSRRKHLTNKAELVNHLKKMIIEGSSP